MPPSKSGELLPGPPSLLLPANLLHMDATFSTPRLRRFAPYALLLLIFMVGVQTRLSFFRTYGQTLIIQGDSAVYVSMAANLHHGIGWMDPGEVERFNANPMGFRPTPTDPTRLVPFYGGIDLGYALCYWVALHTFGVFVPAVVAMVYLQMLVDVINILLMFVLGRRVLGDTVGLLAAGIYAGLWSPVSLATTFPFYYYWSGAFALWNLLIASLLLDASFPIWSPRKRMGVSILWGLMLGLATMIRALFLPVGIILCVLLLWRHRGHVRVAALTVVVALAVQFLVMSPVYGHNYARFGRFNTRWMWHTAYIGFGAHPNPWGIKWDDNDGFDRAVRGGLSKRDPEWVIRYDEYMRGVVLGMYRDQPWLVARNAVENLAYGLTGVDGALVLRWTLGDTNVGYNWQLPNSVETLVYSPQVVIGVILVLQFAWFTLFGRRQGDVWTYLAILLSSCLMLGTISILCPPYAMYNAAYSPGFAVFAALAIYALTTGTVSAFRLLRREVAAYDTGSTRWIPVAVAALFAPSLFVRHVRVLDHALESVVALACGLMVFLVVRQWLTNLAARFAFATFIIGASAGLVLGWAGAGERMTSQFGLPACLQILGGLVPLLLVVHGAATPWVAALLTLCLTTLHPEVLWLPLTFMLSLETQGWETSLPILRKVAAIVAILGTPTAVLMWWNTGSRFDLDLIVIPVVFLALSFLLPSTRRRPIVRFPIVVALAVIKTGAFPSWRLLMPCLLVSWSVWRWSMRSSAAWTPDVDRVAEAAARC